MNTLNWAGSGPRTPRPGIALPPIGQGLALIAIVSIVSFFTLFGIAAYIWSLRVADARSELAGMNTRFMSAQSDIDALQRDYAIRSRMLQLDRWRQQLNLGPAGIAQIAHNRSSLFTLAKARGVEMVNQTEDARPVDSAPGHGYTARARTKLDDLIGAVAVN